MIVIRKVADIEDLGVRAKVPAEVCQEIDTLARLLDGFYGEARDADSDGGIIVVAENVADLGCIKAKYASLSESDCEGEVVIASSNGNYINRLYLSNNEFGVNVIMPAHFLERAAQP